MEAGIIAVLFFVFVLGIAIGFVIEKSKSAKTDTQGIIYVYCRDAESSPSLLLEYGVPIDDIMSRKRVVFEVKVVR